jgi:TolB-like protein/Flp pilus assembly protein TadD
VKETNKAVFLSYASQDSEAARRLCDALQAVGVEVWFDRSELRGGDAWDQKIRRQIKDCALFMPVISANTQSRAEGYFRLEWHLAEQRSHLIAHGKPFIVPVCVDDTPDAEALAPDAFLAVQWMRVPGGAASAAFAERVATLLHGSPAGTPSTAPRPSTDAPMPVRAAPPRKSFRVAWVVGAVLAAAAVGAVLFYLRAPGVKPPATPAVAAPVSEARQLAERARAIMVKGDLTRAQLDTAGELCDRALQLDPADAIAWNEAAHADLLHIHPYGYDRSDERRKRAQFRATRALDLAPDVLEVRAMHAAVIAHAGGSPALLAEAETVFRDLVASHPGNHEFNIQLAEVLREEKRYDEAATVFESIGEYEIAGWSYFLAGQGRKALTAVERSLREKRAVTAIQLKSILLIRFVQDLTAAQATVDQLRPSELLSEMQGAGATETAMFRRDPERMLEIMRALPADYLQSYAFTGPRQFFIGVAHMLAGRTGAAESEWRAGLALVQERLKSASEDRELLLWAAWLQASLGAKAEAERLLDRAQDVAGLDRAAVDVLNLKVFLRLGRNDAVLAWLATVFRTKAPNWEETHSLARFHPMFDPLRGNPRFEKLLRDNLPPGAKPFDEAKPADETPPTASASTAPVEDAKSVAVLPFVNRSNREEDAFFTDGIHDDLLTRISRIKNLKTISRTSVMGYRGTAKNLRQIGQELGVTTIIEGGVQRAGSQVRINVQLIDARQDKHLWAETYDRELTAENVFAIQSEIATAVASALQAVLTPEATRDLPTRNLDALEAYFRAKSNDGSAAQTAAAIAHLERALALDPDFAEAHALVADQYLRQVWTDGRPAAEQVAKAQPHVERALALAPQSSSAYMALGHLRNRQRDIDGAVAELRKANELGPNNAAAYALLGYVQLWSQRDSGAAVQSYRRALELDPLSPLIRQQMAEALSVDGRFDDARTQLDQLLKDAPTAVEGIRNYGELQEHAYHRLDQAIKAYRRAVALDPKNPNFASKVALAYFRLGDKTAAKSWLERALALGPQSRETGFLRGLLSLIADDGDAAQALFRTVRTEATFYGQTLTCEFYAVLADGRSETAAALLATLAPPPRAITQGNVRAESIRACLLAAAKQQAEADKLIDQITMALPRLLRVGPRGYFTADAWILLARGERGEALKALRTLSDTQYCDADFGANPVFRTLRDDPQFQELVRINDARIAEQRANLSRWEEAGELAAIPALPAGFN